MSNLRILIASIGTLAVVYFGAHAIAAIDVRPHSTESVLLAIAAVIGVLVMPGVWLLIYMMTGGK